MEENEGNTVINNFAEGSNCQVFNAPVTGSIFAMPGSSVHQHVGEQELKEEEKCVLSQLTPIFYGDEEEAEKFLNSIDGMKPTQITNLVKRLADERKISDRSMRRDLWKVLSKAGLYPRTESNWNDQLK